MLPVVAFDALFAWRVADTDMGLRGVSADAEPGLPQLSSAPR
jgi:hypothetical protein